MYIAIHSRTGDKPSDVSVKGTIAYFNRGRNAGELDFEYTQNIDDISEQGVIDALEKQKNYLPVRKNTRYYCSAYASFSGDDFPFITEEKLQDLLKNVIIPQLNLEKTVLYATCHIGQNQNVHIHFFYSSNNYKSDRNSYTRFGRKEFLERLQQIEVLQIAKHPEIKHSIAYSKTLENSLKRDIKHEDRRQRKLNYKALKAQLGKGIKTDKEVLKSLIQHHFSKAKTVNDFISSLLSENEITPYNTKSGKTAGVIYQGRKYRFTNFIHKEALKELQKNGDEQVLYRERKRQLEQLLKQKENKNERTKER